MERESTSELHPAFLPPGTVVGPWRVIAWAGRGVYGAVYRAVPVQDEHASPVALKLALHPGDPRFAREGELLPRAHHPSIPRLLDAGEWVHPSGTRHPYIAMEWIDGVPLYAWAQPHNPSSQQVLQHLAQLASALHALHSRGCVHRDVKGGNVLVRRSDSRAILIDLGSGSYAGASTLTPPLLIPGTPAYRSPEAWLFELRGGHTPRAPYSATPADDIYALGVTAYRLVTGEYPELAAPFKDEHGVWQLGEAPPVSPLVLNPRVEPRLSALILRMLSVHPEQRGTAAEWTEMLEQAAQLTVRQSAQPILVRETPPAEEVPREAATRNGEARVAEVPSPARGSEEHSEPRSPARHWRPRLSLVAVGLALITWAWWVAPSVHREPPASVQRKAVETGSADAGPAGLGEAATTASPTASPEPDGPQALAEDTLPEPLPGQTRPDTKGRCPHKGQVALNRGCWVEMSLDREACEALALSGYTGHMFKTRCYVPAFSSGKQPTSSPAHKP